MYTKERHVSYSIHFLTDTLFFFFRELFKTGEMQANVRALSAITCLLEGPFDCGQNMLSVEGVLETMVAMTGSDEVQAQVSNSTPCIIIVLQFKYTLLVPRFHSMIKSLMCIRDRFKVEEFNPK